MIAVWIIIGIAAGALVVYFIMRMEASKNGQQSRFIEEEKERLAKENLDYATENKKLLQENSRLSTQVEMNAQSVSQLKEGFDRERQQLTEARLETEKNAERLRKESDEQWQLKFDKLKEEFQNMAARLLSEKQEALQQNNKEQLGDLLNPLKEQFAAFKKSVEDSRTSSEVAKKELKDSFEATLKLFSQQQNQAVEALKQETIKIGNDANNLTNALKRDTKKQGNWGELVLESILEASGLMKDVQYFIQETVLDEEGRMKRPDVIVKFPEGRSVIIDSKVSLTAYTEAFESEDEDYRRRRLKDHAKSVKKHVDELAGKKYDDVVENAIGFILMFIPNDQCYLCALEEDPDLSRYAYGKGIVLISPSNLMMALQLAFNMWQQDIRNKNIENIVKTAEDLYDKVSNFSESMESVEKSLTQLNAAYNKAKNQLYEGNGNIMRRVETLKSFGLTPKKQIKGL